MRRLLALGLGLLVAGSVAAFDWGGYVDNTTGVSNPTPGVDSPVDVIQSTTGALWANHALGVWKIDAQGSYTYTPSLPMLFDLDKLTIGANVIATDAGATTVGLTAGRMVFTDATGYVLNHRLDGLKLQINQPTSSLIFGIGTTALLQKPTNQIILSTADSLDLGDSAVLFAPPRLIANAQYRMLELVAGQHLTVGATIQQDLRPEDQLTQPGTTVETPFASGHIDTQHLNLMLSGPVGPGLYETFYYTLSARRSLQYVEDVKSSTGSWYQYETSLGHMAGAELTYFMPEVLNSRARLFGQFTTGGDVWWASDFIALSPVTYSDQFSLEPGNSAHVGISYSLRPLAALGMDILQTELKGVAYFRSTGSGAVSAPTVDPLSDGAYVGTDVGLTATIVPLSDLRFILKGGAFIPNNDVMGPQNQNVEYQVTLQGVLRL